ncbi:MAG TPA: molybdenum cofactor synthesis domain-containing protein, partial [Thermodesulfovibrionales bacterium]|nr:molybdenum cofactor synthesis domain-containing protein [Thermodesulfovibrionales bacterium]
MKKNIYLKSTPLDEALGVWEIRLKREGLLRPLAPESVQVSDSLGRVTAEALIAKISSPFYHAAAMDGYAVRFAETFGASETHPVKLRMGEQAFYVDTGDPMPGGFNAVVMIEEVNKIGSGKSEVDGGRAATETADSAEYIEIIEPATPWQHVRTIGEDIVATELILPENHKIRPMDIGALLAGGHTDIMVRRRPLVAVIPTGDELIEPGTTLSRGSIIEYNSRVLGSLVHEWGGEPIRFSIVPDDISKLKEAVRKACGSADLVVVNAGSSAGSEDYTARAIQELGEVVIHGVGIKPGKPVVLGIVRGKPVLGIPGYPVSAFITFHLFAGPLIHLWQGIEKKSPERIRAKLSRQVASSL